MEVCKELREMYEVCFNIWFSEKFLKGNHNESMCAPLLKDYTKCVKVRFLKIESNILKTFHLIFKYIAFNFLIWNVVLILFYFITQIFVVFIAYYTFFFSIWTETSIVATDQELSIFERTRLTNVISWKIISSLTKR